MVVRFLFGVGEAGAYPGATRALYSWLTAKERGLGQGIFHSGARIGAAPSLVLMPRLIDAIGWRMTFVANAVLGLLWRGCTLDVQICRNVSAPSRQARSL